MLSVATEYGLMCASAATVVSVSTEPTSIRAPSPIEVLPRSATPGPIHTSVPSGPTSASMYVLAGSTRVTPARIHASLMRRRAASSTAARSTRSLMPATSVNGASIAVAPPRAAAWATRSVR